MICSENVDASRGIFTDIGRDQNFNLNVGQIRIGHIHVSLFGSRNINLPLHTLHNGSNNVERTTLVSQPSSRTTTLDAYSLSEGVAIVDITTGLIVQIVQLLIVPQAQQSDKHRDLRLELKALYDLLVMTGTAIQEYKDRPLGPSLINAVTSQVDRCRIVLKELLDRVSGTWWGLQQTSIGGLWRPVWWSRWDGDELALLRRKLSGSGDSLRGFLRALNSYVLFGFHASSPH